MSETENTNIPVTGTPRIPHPGAVHGPKIRGKRRWHLADHYQRSTRRLTNHERVVQGCARRMRISVAEYRRRYCDH